MRYDRLFVLTLSLGLAASAGWGAINRSGAEPQDAPAGGTGAASTSADDQDTLSDEEALVLDGKSYAARFNVPLDEAMRRITLMAGTGDDIAALGQEFGDSVAGIYFDNGSDFGVKVRLTGQEKRASRRLDRKAARQAARKAVRQAAQADRRAARGKPPVSDAELSQAASVLDTPTSTMVEFIPGARQGRRAVRQAIKANFAQVEQSVPTLQGVAYDERKAAVVIQVAGPESSLSTAVRATLTSLFAVPVEFEFIARPLSPTTLRGGTQLSYPDSSPMCTTAFVGADPSGRAGVFTAAHCYAIGGQAIWYTDTDGKRYQLPVDTALNLYTTKEDILFLRFPAGLAGAAQFYANRNEAARAVTGRRTLGTTDTASGTAQGTYVCFYGMTSGPNYGQGCGDVRYKEFAASTTGSQGKMTVSNGPSYYVQVQGPTASFHCGPGDSGSPWFVYNTAFGIMSSCGENMVGSDSVANYTSFDAAYARSYKLTY